MASNTTDTLHLKKTASEDFHKKTINNSENITLQDKQKKVLKIVREDDTNTESSTTGKL